MLITGDYKFDQTPGGRRAGRHLAPGRAGPRGPAAALRRLHQRRPPGRVAVASRASGPRLSEVFAPLHGPDHRHLLRLEHPPRPAGGRRRGRARAQGRAGRPLDAQERQHRPHARAHRHPRGHARPAPARSRTSPTRSSWSSRPGARASRCRALRRMAHGDHPHVELHSGDTVIFSATPIPGNERAVNETIDRHLPASAPTSITAADAPIHASGHGYAGGAEADAQPHPAALRDAGPRRPQAAAAARRAGRGRGRARRGRSSGARTACRSRSTSDGARFGEREQAGHDLRGRRRHRRHRRRRAARPPHALGRRHLHRRRDDLRAGRPLGRRRPRSSSAACPFLDDEPTASSTSCARRSRTRSTASAEERDHARSTCSRRTCTTTSPSSSTSGCAPADGPAGRRRGLALAAGTAATAAWPWNRHDPSSAVADSAIRRTTPLQPEPRLLGIARRSERKAIPAAVGCHRAATVEMPASRSSQAPARHRGRVVLAWLRP